MDYIGCIDDDALERWPAFFTVDGLYRIVSREHYARGLPASFVYCRGQGMMHDRIVALRRANIYEPHVYRHLVSGTRLRCEEPGGGWRFHTNFQVIRTMHTGEMVVFAVVFFETCWSNVRGPCCSRKRPWWVIPRGSIRSW